MTPLANPMKYDEAFPLSKPPAEVPENTEECEVKDDVDNSFVNSLEDKLPKAGPLLAELLRKCFAGPFDDTFQKFAVEEPSVLDQALQTQSSDRGEFGKEFDEVLKAMQTAQQVVGTSGGALPKMSLRDLVRRPSEADSRDEVELERQRSEVWKQAVAKRKKLLQFGLYQFNQKAQNYADVFKKASAAQNFKGKATESHRMFSMAGDLMTDTGDAPWLTKAGPNTKVLEAMLEFMKMQRAGKADVLVGFDGCCREVRLEMGKAMLAMPSTSEVFVIYTSSWNAWAQRQSFLSSKNCEVGYISLPVSRGKVKCKERPDGFNAAGESSSHFSSMSGVTMPPRTRLPRISIEEKEKVFGKSGSLPEKWVKHIVAGCPLVWGETKSVQFWLQLIKELDVSFIVDLTPGSGALAEAAMIKGISYFGFVANPVHLGWLTNVIDRASVRQIAKNGSFLYQEDLAKSLQEMFSDIVECDGDDNKDDEDPDDVVRPSDDEGEAA